MPKKGEPPAEIDREGDASARTYAAPVVLIPHDRTAGPVTAVKNVLLQASISTLKTQGHYDRYTELMLPRQLDELLASLGPGWIPIDLALAHYQACDDLALSEEDFVRLGETVGERVQETLLVSTAKRGRATDFDLRNASGQLHRMWARIYRGGSAQLVALGPKESQLEARGYVLFRFHYFRRAQVAAMRTIFDALGSRSSVRLISYSEARDEALLRVTWA